MDKVKAVGHRVIVKPDPIVKKSEGGIILAVNEKMERAGTQKGTVVDIGTMAWKNELYGFGKPGWEPWCKIGDRILFPRYGGKLICINDGPHMKDEDREFLIVINDEDVQLVLTEEGVEEVHDDYTA